MSKVVDMIGKQSGISIGCAAVILSSVACASAPAAGTPQADRIIATSDAGVIRDYDQRVHKTVHLGATRDSIFAALRTIYNQFDVEVRLQNPATGELGNANFTRYYKLGGRPLHEYVGCGSTMTGPAADSYRVQLSLVSYVSPDSGGSRVQTKLTGRADDPGTSKGWMSCLTTGVLEERVNQLLVKIINQ